jgi:hypothetical protein
MRLMVDIDMRDLPGEIAALPYEESQKLIFRVDEIVGDYDYTLDLARKLVADLIACSEAGGEPFDLQELVKKEQ